MKGVSDTIWFIDGSYVFGRSDESFDYGVIKKELEEEWKTEISSVFFFAPETENQNALDFESRLERKGVKILKYDVEHTFVECHSCKAKRRVANKNSADATVATMLLHLRLEYGQVILTTDSEGYVMALDIIRYQEKQVGLFIFKDNRATKLFLTASKIKYIDN